MKTTKNRFIRLLVPGLVLVVLIGLLAVNVFGKYRKTVTLTAEISYHVQSGSPAASIVVTQKEAGMPAADIVITGKTDAPANLYLTMSGENREQFTPNENWLRIEGSPIEGISGDFYQYQKSIPTGDSVIDFSVDGDAETETQLNLTAYLVRDAIRNGEAAPLPYLASQTCFLKIAGPEDPEPSETESEPTDETDPEDETEVSEPSADPTEPTPEPTTEPRPEPTTEPKPEPTTPETEPEVEAPTEVETQTPAETDAPAVDSPAEPEAESSHTDSVDTVPADDVSS